MENRRVVFVRRLSTGTPAWPLKDTGRGTPTRLDIETSTLLRIVAWEKVESLGLALLRFLLLFPGKYALVLAHQNDPYRIAFRPASLSLQPDKAIIHYSFSRLYSPKTPPRRR